ncbi:transcription regulator HTH, apses-type DNA-binding domain-containing protein [Thelephora terrestris]|uniref:Transcription regulator HTH, apses-type DNA-binding domain-containing protein n=1 Tax=Thelephora terrestris TaxID=56493 RepID=A0A9P6LB38_9AGAM|nr:transcription regulator HTH, apses-type DNA-binding domain-containing protein [Thelephora terrestris]
MPLFIYTAASHCPTLPPSSHRCTMTPSSPTRPRRPFPPDLRTDIIVTKGRYITSNDPRGYIPVYEYSLQGQWIMMDMDDGYILWTGIWKALGHSKADIVKFLESEPEVAPLIRRIRGGYLKIQGTWMPFEIAERLSRRVAWDIRYDLVPLFGPSFPDSCLAPNAPGFGEIIPIESRRRRSVIPHYMVSNSNHMAFMSSFDLAIRPSFNEHSPVSSQNIQPAVHGMMYQENQNTRQQGYEYTHQTTRRGSLPEILPPLRSSSANSMVTLPSISAFDDHPSMRDSPMAVLKRLKNDSTGPA